MIYLDWIEGGLERRETCRAIVIRRIPKAEGKCEETVIFNCRIHSCHDITNIGNTNTNFTALSVTKFLTVACIGDLSKVMIVLLRRYQHSITNYKSFCIWRKIPRIVARMEFVCRKYQKAGNQNSRPKMKIISRQVQWDPHLISLRTNSTDIKSMYIGGAPGS